MKQWQNSDLEIEYVILPQFSVQQRYMKNG